MMTIQMIRSDIQDSTDLGTECMYCLQLKTADLRHYHRRFLCLESHIRIWIPDISHNENTLFPVVHDFSEKGCGCCLSVGTCNCKDISFSENICQFNLSPHRNPTLMHFPDDRKIRWNAGTHHHKRQPVQHLIFLLFRQ